MPLSIMNEVMNKNWIMSQSMCDCWLAADVWLSTASILNLVVIGFDRFIAICRPLKYSKIMRKCFARILVASVWVVASIISLPTTF
ncbi:UNVERIFIED_CONTAM: hypothetical protein GTU68_028411, partial [Idotea baltica]|nr:hypothetical protein [Idotea baltica]